MSFAFRYNVSIFANIRSRGNIKWTPLYLIWLVSVFRKTG
jgi:hypothetical protein